MHACAPSGMSAAGNNTPPGSTFILIHMHPSSITCCPYKQYIVLYYRVDMYRPSIGMASLLLAASNREYIGHV